MKFLQGTILGAGLLFAAIPATAQAGELVATFTGTVSFLSGNSYFDGASQGSAATEVFVFDPTVAPIDTDGVTYAQQQSLGPFAILSASLTVNGVTWNIAPNVQADLGQAIQAAGPGIGLNAVSFGAEGLDASSPFLVDWLSGSAYLNIPVNPSLDTIIGETSGNGADAGGFFIEDETGQYPLAGVFTDATISVEAVPEPVTLSLFGAGLAGAFAARRKTRKS
jgi:hypothetical protein